MYFILLKFQNHTVDETFLSRFNIKNSFSCLQRPLTRYLPVRNAEFDLRHHIESAGHQTELCAHVHVTSSSCHGYLHKLGGAWRTWRKRWFVFDRTQKALLYYGDKGETKLKGGVNFQVWGNGNLTLKVRDFLSTVLPC